MFCARCGKEIKGFGLCVACYLDLNPIYVENFEIVRCPVCGHFLYKTWNEKIDNMQIIKNIKFPEKIEVRKIDLHYKISKILNFTARIYGKYNNEEFEREISGKCKIIKKICIECSRSARGYYEAIIQFRGNEVQIKRAMEFLNMNKKFISKVEEVKNGCDVYLTSKDFANSLIKIFSDGGATIKLSKSIGGVKDGKTVFRKCILIKFPDLNVGDYVLFKNKICKILKVGKILICEINNKEKRIPINKVAKIPKDELSNYLNTIEK